MNSEIRSPVSGLGVALVRNVGVRIGECELSHLPRRPIDVARAREQHEAYVTALARAGWTVRVLPDLPDRPDAVFVEDCAVVVEEVAVVARPGAESRQAETETVAAELRRWRPVLEIGAPATLDGGDVLRLGRRLWVGRTARSSAEGIRALREGLEPWGYEVRGVDVRGALHLKTVATAVGDRMIVADPRHVDPDVFDAEVVFTIEDDEPGSANVLDLGSVVLVPESAPRLARRLTEAGFGVETVPQDELAKAEAGLTCCSILIPRV